MILFSSLVLFFVSSLIYGFLINPIGFSGIILCFFTIILFTNKIFNNFNKKKIIIIILILIFIFIKISFNIIYKEKTINTINQTKQLYIVREKNLNWYLLKNKNNQNILLNKIFFSNSKIKKIILEINDQINVSLKIKEIKNTNSNFYWYSKSKNIKYKAYLNNNSKFEIIKSKSIYNKILNFFNSSKNQKYKNWIKFLIFQEKTNEIEDINQIIKNLNISHLFVVSGFHLFLVSWIWFWFSKKSKNSILKILFKIIGILLCLFLNYLSNWKLSTTKATIILFWISFLKNKIIKFETIELISILGLICLIFNPLFVIRIDYQLSFFTSLICVFFYRFKTKWKLFNIFKINILVFILILPILINLNFKFSIFSFIFSTIFGIFSFVFFPIFLTFIWILPFDNIWGEIFFFIEKIFYWINSWNIQILTGKINWYQIIIYYSVFIFLFKIIKIININFFKNLFFILIWTITTILLIFTNLNKSPYYELTMFNVGHGLSMLLQSPDKKTNILLDAGIGRTKNKSKNKIILNNLLKKGISKLDAVFISHKHVDHYNNLEFLKNNIKIKSVYTNKNSFKKYKFKDFEFYNLSYFYYQKMEKENNKSLVLYSKIKNKNFLFTFDAEKEAELEIIKNNKLNIDFLQVGHHGLKSSSTKIFLNEIKPKFCFISANKISYIRNKLENYNCKVYNTYNKGNLNIKIINNKLKVTTEF